MIDYSEDQDEEKLARNNPLGERGRPRELFKGYDYYTVNALAVTISIFTITLMLVILL